LVQLEVLGVDRGEVLLQLRDTLVILVVMEVRPQFLKVMLVVTVMQVEVGPLVAGVVQGQ
jgi:hypothetical protein|tara:strand:+ start:284 stop:463 length:180 start_codon:yes stop_codon:yes gene_type:complete